MKDFLAKYKPELIIFFIAVIVRVIFFYIALKEVNFQPADLRADGYYEIADNLLKFGVFSRDVSGQLLPDSIRTPGLPALIYSSYRLFNTALPFFFLQIIASGLIPVLARRLALKSKLRPALASLIASFLIFEPLGLSLTAKMLSEIFFTFFFLLSLLWLLNFLQIFFSGTNEKGREYWFLAASAVSAGVAALIRPSIYLLPVFLIAAWLGAGALKKKLYLKPALLFFFFFYIIVLPWYVRNYRVFGNFSFTSVQDQVLFTALSPSLVSLRDNVGYPEGQRRFFLQNGFDYFPEVYLDTAGWFRERSVPFILGHPKELVKMSVISVITFFTHDGVLEFQGNMGWASSLRGMPHFLDLLFSPWSQKINLMIGILKSPALAIVFMRAVWSVIFLSLVFSSIYLIKKKRLNPELGLFLFICIYFSLTTISNGLAVNSRFRFPINSLILIIALKGVSSWNRERGRKIIKEKI
ncbi:MAG: phospholipid carrier-dependent glycosyltransferase [Patescibacteria group bacterium]|jgi:4-amino-4-deoxy-L-arabinose transferase-like glycosyltransferase